MLSLCEYRRHIRDIKMIKEKTQFLAFKDQVDSTTWLWSGVRQVAGMIVFYERQAVSRSQDHISSGNNNNLRFIWKSVSFLYGFKELM
jgi:hypothetical protein